MNHHRIQAAGLRWTGFLLVIVAACVAPAAENAGTFVQGAKRGTLAIPRSPHAQFRPVTMDEAAWTSGFWADRFERCRTTTLPAVEAGLLNPENSEQLLVLLIAAGEKPGPRKGKGTNWTDGDCYKWIEALAWHSAVTDDPALTERMDYWIDVIAQAQSPDGYLSTNFWDNPAGRLQVPYNHEMYNMGHLLTAASVHYRETGQTNFLAVARRMADFLYLQFQPRPPRLVHFPWNPSALYGPDRPVSRHRRAEIPGTGRHPDRQPRFLARGWHSRERRHRPNAGSRAAPRESLRRSGMPSVPPISTAARPICIWKPGKRSCWRRSSGSGTT